MTTARPTAALLQHEATLLRRSPGALIWTVAAPVAAVVVMLLVPAARRSLEAFGGLSVVEAYQPTLVVFACSMIALQIMPMTLGQHRETGFLRRLRATPTHPAHLLVAVLLLVLLVCLGVGAVLLGLPLLVGVGSPARTALAVLAVVPAALSFLGVGAFLAAVIPSPRVASGVGTALAAVMWFFAGMWFPRAQFPGWLVEVADWTPGGAAATLLTGTARGLDVSLQPVICLLLWGVLGLVVAVRTFRWE